MKVEVAPRTAPAGGVPGHRSGAAWRTVVGGAAAVLAALHATAAILLTDLEATGLAAAFAVVAVAGRRWPRPTAVALVVLLVNTLIWTVPGAVATLTGGAAVAAVALQVSLAGVASATLVAMVALVRGSDGARVAAVASSLVVVATLGATAVAAVAGGGPAQAEPGDLVVVGENTRFQPEALRAPAGTVSVHLSNQDFFWHTFSIPDLGVRLAVPTRSQGRVTFEAPPGTYRYVCDIPGHAAVMRGQLTVVP